MSRFGNRLRVAVVGVGYLGAHHARIYSEMPEVELVGVVDADLERAQAVAERHGCLAFSQVAALEGRIDAASVVTTTITHAVVADALLAQGVHLLLEKPMTVTLAEADALIAAADQAGVILQIGHVERFNPGVRALMARAGRSRFIESHRMGPFSKRGADVSVVLDLMIHDIDLALAFIPSPVVEIRASGVSVLTPHTDIANARIAFANGAVANLTASRVSQARMRKIRVFSPWEYFSLDAIAQEITRCRPASRTAETDDPGMVVEKIVVEKGEALRAEIVAFIQSVTTGTPLAVSGRDGRAALAVAIEVESQIRLGQGDQAGGV